ncbi:hypothetical protein SNE40_003435 [Patella caerulea]|uniref:GLTSCR protein conserved domain-containing protein n=2 Tax=Patella caerulea TaxID=87958 RepID=A0AAN8KAQ1_PATCE
MPPSEMEDGLEVNIDEFFGEGSTSIPSFEDGEGFSWADDFISSATGAFADRPSAAITTTTNVLSSSIAQVSQNSIPQNVPNQQQIAVSASQMGQTTFMQQQQQFSMVNLQPQLQGTGGLLHGCSFRHAKYRKKGFHSVPQYIIKSTTAGPIQSQQQTQIQQPRSSPAPSSYSANSPLTSRTVTPSCSPAPAMSPLVSRSITPIQSQSAIVTANTSRPPSHSSSPAPNILQFNQNNLQARPQVQLANTVPIQGFIQSSPNTSIISGQNTLTPNIVHTQNAVIQNPNVVNLNVAHVLCNNNQTMGQQNVQNLPATMQNPMNIQGTIIQTANGKSILIPNNNLQGQQINLAGMQNISVGHPNTIGQPMIQNQQNLGNVIRLAPQQDKQPSVAQPNYSFVSVGNQGQQIFLQRAPNPGQPQNIILRSVPQNVILQPQGQGQTTGKQPTPIQPHQIPQQIPQQIVNQQPHQNIQFQQVFTGAGQPMKIVTQGGGQVGSQSGAVTLNLAGQNLNLQQLAGLGIGTNNLQGLQFGNGGQFILQPQPQQQQQQQQQIFQTVPKINPQPTTATPPAAVDPLTQALSMSGITENGSHFNEPTLVQTPPPEIVKKVSKSKAKKAEADRTQIPQMSVQVQPITSSASINVQSSLSQLMATAASVAGISSNCSGPVGFNTVFSTAQGTVVTTTISQSFVQTPSSLSIVTNSIGGQIINTGSQLNTSNILSTNQIKGQVFGQGVTVNQTTPTQNNQQMSNDAKHIQRIDTEIKRLMSLKSMTADQKREVQQMSVLQKKLMAANQNVHLKNINQSSSSSQMVGQPAIAQPHVVQPGQTPILQISNPISHTHQQAPVQHVIQSVQNTQSSSNSIFHNTPQQQQTSGVVQFTLAQSQPTTTLLSSTSQVMIQPSTSLNKNIPHTRNVQIQPGPIMSTGSAMSSVPAGKLPITAIPAMPTQIKFGNQMLTLNLTPQQKEKLQMHLSKMTIEQQEQFLKHQSTLKLQQKQQQIQALQKQAAAQQQQAQTSSLPALLTSGTKMPQTVNNSGGGTSVKTEPGQQTTLNRGGKVVSTEIPKASLIHQQMSKDQQNAVAPDTKAPFKNSREACRRLLRYHVFQWSGPSKQEYERADCMLEQRSADLLNKSRTMMDKYRLLLLNDSMRQNPSAEMVMIQRMLQQDLTACIKEEKRQIQEDPESFQPMPLKFLKIKESTSDQSFEDNKSVKKESSFEEETSVHDTSEESDQNVAIPFDKSAPVFKSSPSSGTMKLLIRKQSQGFVSSLASEGSDSPKPSSPLVSVKMEPIDSNFEIRSSKYSKSGSSDTCDSVYSKSLGLASDMSYPKAKIKSEPHTSDPKNPLHIHIDSDVEVNHDASFQHSDESYEDYKDSVLISRDMSNMSHTDVSDASMTEDLHAEFDRTISSPMGQSYPNPRHHESKSVNDMPLNISENLTESICNDRSGQERGDIVDSVESGTYSSISPSQYHSGLGIVGNNVNDDDIYLPCSSVGQGQTSNVDVSSRTFCSSDSVLTRTNSLSNELMSVDPNEIQSLNNRPLSSYSVSSYHRQISSAEVSEFESNDFNTSFGSDSVTEPQNSLLSNQMQSAIDSILDNEQEQDQDETADDYLPDQSNSLNSQDVSEDDFDEEEDASMEEYSPKHQWSKGDNSDIEDDDDEDSAAVKSILM